MCIWHYPLALKTGKSYGFFKSSNINNKVEHTSGQKMGKIILIDFLSTISYWYVNENSLLHDLALRVAEQKQVLNFTTTVKSVVLKLFILWLNDWVCCSFRKLQVCWFLSLHHILQRLGPNELLFFYSLSPIKSAISILIKIFDLFGKISRQK